MTEEVAPFAAFWDWVEDHVSVTTLIFKWSYVRLSIEGGGDMITYIVIFGFLFIAASGIGCLISRSTFGNQINISDLKQCRADRNEFCMTTHEVKHER